VLSPAKSTVVDADSRCANHLKGGLSWPIPCARA
jgi:hypothetical protein